MNEEEFKKTIMQDELTPTENDRHVMWKSYLSILLKGGIKRQNCFIYSIQSFPLAFALGEGEPLPLFESSKKQAIQEMTAFLNKIKAEGKWEEYSKSIEYYDKNGKSVDPDGNLVCGDTVNQASAKKITEVRTIYFLSDDLDIKSFIEVKESGRNNP